MGKFYVLSSQTDCSGFDINHRGLVSLNLWILIWVDITLEHPVVYIHCWGIHFYFLYMSKDRNFILY